MPLMPPRIKEIMADFHQRQRAQREAGGALTPYDGPPLEGADLSNLYLFKIKLSGVKMPGSDWTQTSAVWSDLSGTDLSGARLKRTNLMGADLTGADLTGADLEYTTLWDADLTGAIMPDGRTLEEWRLDPLLGICDTPEARERAQAAYGGTWQNCPMHAVLGISSFIQARKQEPMRALRIATFVALFDAGQLGESWRGTPTTEANPTTEEAL